MTTKEILKSTGQSLAAGAAMAAVGYAALVAYNRARYGQTVTGTLVEGESLLDRFIPDPEVVEHHEIAVNAPAAVVMSTAKEMELLRLPLIRAIIKARELVLGGVPDTRPHPAQLLEQMRSIGWVVLSETAGREIVLGSVTQPWEAAPIFRSIPPSEFRDFAEPGFVKIAWTLRADPDGPGRSVFHTETRVCTTDAESRDRFRRYWSFVAPGVELIRLAMLRPLKTMAEKKRVSTAA